MAGASRQSGEYYRSLFENAAVGLYRSTADGRFVAVNPALVEMLGYESKAELLAIDLAKDLYVTPADRSTLIERYCRASRVDAVETVWRRKDGTHITVRLSGRPIRGADGELEAFEMMVEDVTARRLLEDQLRQSQKMEVVGQLTGGIAHDFNNVLTTIVVNAEYLQHLHAFATEEAQVLIVELERAARRGTEMIKKLMMVSRSRPLSFEPVEAGVLLAQLAPVLQRLLTPVIEVQGVVAADLPTMRADAGALEQVLLNLATNARDAMPEGGVLRLEAARAWLDEQHVATYGWGVPGAYVCLSVSDSGAGMDADTQRRAFEPFFTTKPPGTGTGLGLAMVYGIMKQHQGFVHLYSELGHGTTVKLYVPLAGEAAASTAAVLVEPPRGSEHVLVVEDDLSIRRVTVRVLRQLGYRITEASDGADALALLERGDAGVDLVVSDLVMPRMGGRELYRRMRAAGLTTPVLVVSGYADAASRGDAEVGSDVRFLHKPWTITEMAVRLRETLGAKGTAS